MRARAAQVRLRHFTQGRFEAAFRQGGRKVETIKTATIVVLLLAVLYAVYTVLNKPASIPPDPEIAWHEGQVSEPLQIDVGENAFAEAGSLELPQGEVPSAAFPRALPAGDAVAASPAFPSTTEMAASSAVPADPLAGVPEAPSASFAEPTPIDEVPSTFPLPGNPPPATPPAGLVADDTTRPPDVQAGQGEAAALEGDAVAWQPPADAFATDPSEPLVPDAAPSGSAPSESAPIAEQQALPSSFDRAMQTAQAKMDDEQWYEALFTLSLQYGDSELTDADQSKLLNQLDLLAGRVIYSKEHLIEGPYQVQRGETLMKVAERYQVPWQLLANINGVDNPDLVLPGTELKVVSGPFRAEVDLAGQELTLFVGRLYAGRFPISLGQDPTPKPGEYRVADKQPGRTYYAGDGRTIGAGDPTNPYGGIWIDLGGDVCIHGSPPAGRGELGCISLSPIDANDVYGILSKGSSVVVRR
jgi:lipoprotein-anchoring transpeptidase ErfK/SrfK